MLPKAKFGRTGHLSTRTLFGAAAFWDVTQNEANRILDMILEEGINHIDTAHSYGKAEERLGPWLKHHRDEFFLATKTEQRTYAGAKEELHRSLELMHTDHIDLWQMHLLVEPDEWETAMGPGGALEAFVEAREQGIVRFLGVTGHGTSVARMHMRSLQRFDFDSVLLPFNYAMMQNPTYAAELQELVSYCMEKDIAVQTIKSITKGPWGDKPKTRNTWYEPLEDQDEIDQAVAYVLKNPGFFLNTVGDINLLPKVLEAAKRFAEIENVEDGLEAMGLTPLFV
jgi:predicted aldo/keto reductase-like oxidoreductase